MCIRDRDYNGDKILPGRKLRWGSAVSLVIGGGLAQEQIPVPELYGLTLGEAKSELEAKGITLAAILPTGPITDTSKAFVYKQNPEAKNEESSPNFIQPGQTMDVWISATPPEPDSTKNNQQGDSLKTNN